MKSILAGLLLLCVPASAQVILPFTFSSGTTIRSSQVNANFGAVANEINAFENSVQSGTPFGIDSGLANAYVVAGIPTPSVLASGATINFIALHTNTGASTLNLNGYGIITLTGPGGVTLQPNQILAGQLVTAVYDGTKFQMVSQQGTIGGTVSSVGLSVPSFLSVSGSPITLSGTLAVGYSGTALPIANGGTNATTQQAAINSLTGAQSSGTYLRSNGTNATLTAIQAADVPSVSASVYLSANSAAAHVPFDTIIFDASGSITTGSSFKFTAPIAGIYAVSLIAVGGGSGGFQLEKNNSVYCTLGTVTSSQTNTSSVILSLGATDTVFINNPNTVTITGGVPASNGAIFSIYRTGN